MSALPTLFVSHGAPNLVLHASPARTFLEQFGEMLKAEYGAPKAILIATAHYETGVPMITADAKPSMIYDFGGFEPELYRWRYDAPGAPALAHRAAGLLGEAGFKAQPVNGRGLDHGAWVPLSLLYPEANIPVAQISVQPGRDGRHHLLMGRALEQLRHEGVLIVGSGSLTHNLQAYFRGGYAPDAEAPSWVVDFADWVREKCEAGDVDAIADYATLAPHVHENHPSPEHFLPLPVAFGAAGPDARGERVHSSSQNGVLTMDAYAFH
jgi:4,5-DOPA dioxygenase extradiol